MSSKHASSPSTQLDVFHEVAFNFLALVVFGFLQFERRYMIVKHLLSLATAAWFASRDRTKYCANINAMEIKWSKIATKSF